VAGKLGRLPVDRANYAAAAKFANIRVAAPLVLIPTETDTLKPFAPSLKMLGNDAYGDCVAVMVANLIYMISGVYPDYAAVIEFYKSQNPRFPSQDNGMNVQTALEYLQKVGMRMPDGTYKKAVFFASVDHANQDEVEEMLALFGMGAYGITVSTRNEQEFDAGAHWSWTNGDNDIGGHAVAGGGYVVNPVLRHFATWAAETSWDEAFDAHRVDELWIVLFEEHVNGKVYVPGVVLSAAAAEFERVTGKPFPLIPTPGPAPGPPIPNAEDLALAHEAHRYLSHWFNSHNYMGRALQQWLNAKGL
jgi:hypothetical protein